MIQRRLIAERGSRGGEPSAMLSERIGVEDILAGLDWLPASAELEYHRPILPGYDVQLAASHTRDQLSCWLLNGTQRLASARLTR